jgi:outer membrane protein insertion porin family
MDTKWAIGFDIDKSCTRYISNDYEINAAGVTLRANREINSFLRFGWHYRIRNSSVEVSEDEHHHELVAPTHLNNPSENQVQNKAPNQGHFNAPPHVHDLHLHGGHDNSLRRAAHNDGIISATGVSLAYDSTNSLHDPSKGFRSRLEFEIAGLGGRYQFWGVAYLNTYYYPLCKKGTLKFRGDFRFLIPFDHTDFNRMPLDERLYLGGDTLVRGYRAYRIGPLFDNDDPKGGLSEQFLSVEYNHKIMKRVEGFLFCDAGHLSDRKWDFGTLRTSVGWGFRIKVLDALPSVCFGMGYPLNAKNRSEVKKFFITFGAKF